MGHQRPWCQQLLPYGVQPLVACCFGSLSPLAGGPVDSVLQPAIYCFNSIAHRVSGVSLRGHLSLLALNLPGTMLLSVTAALISRASRGGQAIWRPR